MNSQREPFLRRVFESIDEYAIITMDLEGRITAANSGVERLLGYRRVELVGKNAAMIFTQEDRVAGALELEMKMARETGRATDDRWHIREDGSRVWVNGIMTGLTSESGELIGFVKVMRDRTDERRTQEALQESEAKHRATAQELAVARDELERQVRERTADLMALNEELQSFNYSVSHDLRAPLRGLTGFSEIMLEEYGDALDEKGRHYLSRVSAAAVRMGELIDALLALSRVARLDLRMAEVDLSGIARSIVAALSEQEPEREVVFEASSGVMARGDERLLRVALENLLGNAWKFTRDREPARIEFGVEESPRGDAYYVRDNGAGFDMSFVDKLFTPFQRLHSPRNFSGIGIGLATVQRIMHRHGGKVWGEGEVGVGATFYFTLAPDSL